MRHEPEHQHEYHHHPCKLAAKNNAQALMMLPFALLRSHDRGADADEDAVHTQNRAPTLVGRLLMLNYEFVLGSE